MTHNINAYEFDTMLDTDFQHYALLGWFKGVWQSVCAPLILACGMVYGYFGFLVLAGFMSKRITYMLVSVIIALTYGSMVFGVLPGRPFVSFEYHLFGMLSGLACAKIWGHKIT